MIDLVEQYNQIIAENPEREGEIGTADVASISVRERRDTLLAESDWRVLPDNPSPSPEAWKTYRQQLRDLPSQEGWPFNVVWPEKPEA